MSDTELAEQVSGARRKVVGTKQTLKALEKGEAILVLLAEDAEAKVSAPVAELAAARGVKVSYVKTMTELGRICGIKVKAAAAAIIEF
ncbi:MAG TPA: ribosomal L7Ae/L30e/S12e/Gadd45 family protein [Bacillota bacterium]|nr:ribosomal L7Ae/L30e/S12e/Gadd45 family protein [Bacillota bacterium]